MAFKMAGRVGAVVLLGLFAQPLFAVYQLVEIRIPAKRLAGVVIDPSGAPISGVNIKLQRCDFQADGQMKRREPVLSTTQTDSQGLFSFTSDLRPRNACLIFGAEGFNPLLVGIEWRSSAPPLEIKLPIGG
jgi:hypothetical protein